MKIEMDQEAKTRIATMIRRASEMTLTEQKLCRIWIRDTRGGDWWDMFQQLRAIADVLNTVGKHEAADMFHEAGQLALARLAYDMQSKEAA